jgi:rRNA small subunit pseudouridine methyltransferase Nep1
MISLILAESALELVPLELQHHPSVLLHAQKLGKSSSKIILDNSWHFAAMKGMNNEIKRGRPDLVHFSILEATTIPLYLQNKIKVYIHTLDDKVIYIGENVHIPKSYHRFEGLIEKLFSEKIIRSNTTILLEIKDKSFSELIDEIKPSKIVGFSTKGKRRTFEQIGSDIIIDNTCIVIGGFQKGHFSESTKSKINHLFSIGSLSYEAHVVIARILYEYEKTVFM